MESLGLSRGQLYIVATYHRTVNLKKTFQYCSGNLQLIFCDILVRGRMIVVHDKKVCILQLINMPGCVIFQAGGHDPKFSPLPPP